MDRIPTKKIITIKMVNGQTIKKINLFEMVCVYVAFYVDFS